MGGIVCYEINRKEKKKNKSDNNVILNKHNSKYNYSSENKPNPKPSLIYGLENNKRIENKSTGNNNGKIKTENKKDKISIKQKDVINLPTKNIINLHQEVLNLHNKERKNRGFKELIFDKHLNGLAQKYADNYQDNEKYNNNINNNKNLYGINYMKFKGDNLLEIINICNNWIQEKDLIDKQKIKKYNSKTKHYSQIIWKNTKQIGCGYSKINNEDSIFVVFYSPAGNVFDKFEENTT